MIPTCKTNTLNQGLLDAVASNSTVTVGRSKENDVQVLDPKVSRFHCKIERTIRGLMLIDLSSKNGTYINSIKCNNALLETGDILKLGDNILTLSPSSPPMVEVTEHTQVSNGLPWVPPPEEHTVDIRIKNSQGSLFKNGEAAKKARDTASTAFSNTSHIASGLRQKKLYLTSAGVLALGIFLIAGITVFNKQTATSSTQIVATAHASGPVPETSIKQQEVPQEEKDKATKIAREAGTVLEAGDFKYALSLFNKSLSLDPDNLLAQEGVVKTNRHIENLARICFTKGQQALKSFDYRGALKELESVVALLKDRPDHELFLKASQDIAQAQLKINN